MFGFSTATQFLQGSTHRTWNCVTNLATVIWNKFNHLKQTSMPRSRKRHHSRSRSKTRSRSPSRDRSYEKQKKPSSHEKDGKRRRLDEIVDSPHHKRSLSFNGDDSTNNERIQDLEQPSNAEEESTTAKSAPKETVNLIPMEFDNDINSINESDDDCIIVEKNENDETETNPELKEIEKTDAVSGENKTISENAEDSDTIQIEVIYDKKEKLTTPKKPLTPKQLKQKIESEKKKQQKQIEKEERERQRQEEKAKLVAEKQRIKEQKQKQLELKQKEKELKEEQRKKEKEEKEQKRKEREEQEAQKRIEKEQEKIKKQQEIEEKNKEKQKEEEKKQKSAALFVNFFKKTETEEKEKKIEKLNSTFMPFEVKSDMRLPPLRRKPLSSDDITEFDHITQNQDENASYLNDLKSGKIQPGKSTKTWPYEDPEEEITVVEEDKILGETIYEDKTIVHKMKAKFLYFHENRRPAYFGTWRKRSKFVKPRKPFGEDTDNFNYEEDSDDDWEEEEQGESLDISGDEEEKDTENDDDYEVDNEFFVPHGHLSDDEVDDEENARLSPESLKQKLKLLKDEFDEDIKSKTHKLKPRSIGCIWFDAHKNNVDDAICRYLQPFALIALGAREIKKRSDIFGSPTEKKKVKKPLAEIPEEHIPFLLKIIHGNVNKKKTVIEEFLMFMANNGLNVDVSKAHLIRFLKQSATYRKCVESGPLKNKYGWFVNDDAKEKYNVSLELS